MPRIAILCGGPTAERGISLNSARSILDNLHGPGFQIFCYYIDHGLRAFEISDRQIYSNTPSDFDFKLRDEVDNLLPNPEALAFHLKGQVDIVFPALHGAFGEDGTIQAALEAANISFVGTSALHASRVFYKYLCSLFLADHGFLTLPIVLLKATEQERHQKKMHQWFSLHRLHPDNDLVIVKPARGGSSIGVKVACGVKQAVMLAAEIISSGLDTRVVVEKYVDTGNEFTIIVIETQDGPVPLIPTEVQILTGGKQEDFSFPEQDAEKGGSEKLPEQHSIFNFRRKYLPTVQVVNHTPATFGRDAVDQIRDTAYNIFVALGLRDFARLDGFFIPFPDQNSSVKSAAFVKGQPVFNDVNIISGMEQTSFLFQQAAEVGMTHSSVLKQILHGALLRAGILTACTTSSECPVVQPLISSKSGSREKVYTQECMLNARRDVSAQLSDQWPIIEKADRFVNSPRKKVYVLFGGGTSERQVSLMSGTNVWLKLRSLLEFEVFPVLLVPNIDGLGLSSTIVWHLPYAAVLRHTVEEILTLLNAPREPWMRALIEKVCLRMREDGSPHRIHDEDILTQARAETLESMVRAAALEGAVVFIALHGGCGENGSLQALLAAAGVPFTGSGSTASRRCIDKSVTGAIVAPLSSYGILTSQKHTVPLRSLKSLCDVNGASSAWSTFSALVGPATSGMCIKPNTDGCSTGVARLHGSADLFAYASAVSVSSSRLNQAEIPSTCQFDFHRTSVLHSDLQYLFLIEPFVSTGHASIQLDEIGSETLIFKENISTKSRWIEVTIGTVGSKGHVRALDPSLTVVASGDILSLEDKFQCGTGINLTPIPSTIVSPDILSAAKNRIERAANFLQVEGLARIDAFLHVDTGDVLIIEANTVPGLTPSTVFFHQALSGNPQLNPAKLLGQAVQHAVERTSLLDSESVIDNEIAHKC